MQHSIQILGSLKIALEEKWNKILKNLFLRHANRSEVVLIQSLKKKGDILSRFTVLCQSYFAVIFLNEK